MQQPRRSSEGPAPATAVRDPAGSERAGSLLRPSVRGKFLLAGSEKLYVRGVTYGTFRPRGEHGPYPSPEVVARDLAAIAAHGMNAVRTYTPPPTWLLDAAAQSGLRVLVDLAWEQHIAFLDQGGRAAAIEAAVRVGVRACRGHPAVLAFAIGNEIPAAIVRWHGHRRIERFLERLVEAARDEDPGALVTYVNYPSTEYLALPFVDFACFNVYLEMQSRFDTYLARLHNLVGPRPLVLAELGLDSRRNGQEEQARSLDWQVRTAFASGCAGAFVFSWTDEWHRGGHDIEDWDFGLLTRDRRPKPALQAVGEAFSQVPLPPRRRWPPISVVVCSYNGERWIRDCFEALQRLDYPDFEVVVVDDGSTDSTARIARDYGWRVLSIENRGLGSARNVGLEAARGEIVAYLDDDAYPDPDWLTYLAAAFEDGSPAAVGGPNLPPPEDGFIARCVASAPGGPIHVLKGDREAEHIPGCNMAFRREALLAIGGFDARFRAAGDDVDVCWRLEERGARIAFTPAAVVWHHRRDSIGAYWRQQRGYGRAEALLERKWPEKYNQLGHVTWEGRLYGNGGAHVFGRRRARIYQGMWGGAPFQSLDDPPPTWLSTLPATPEWYALLGLLLGISALGALWTPLTAALPILVLAAGATVLQAGASAAQALRAGRPAAAPTAPLSGREAFALQALTTFLHVIQPLARLAGRLGFGLSPWRWHTAVGTAFPRPRRLELWSETWRAPRRWLELLEASLRAEGVAVARGGDYDRWDLEARAGAVGGVRILMAVEEHGAGRQLARFRIRPRLSPVALGLADLLAILTAIAAHDRAWVVTGLLAAPALALAGATLAQAAAACAAALDAVRSLSEAEAGAEAPAPAERGSPAGEAEPSAG